MFRSKIDAAARALGIPVTYGQPESIVELGLGNARALLVFVDLGIKSQGGDKGLDPMALIALIRARTKAHIVAFGSHVDAISLAKAVAAGADEALPRSTFTKRVADI